LAAALVDDEVSVEEATEFVHDLVDAQVLTSSLGPPLTGGDAAEHVASEVAAGAPAAAKRLDQIRDLLDRLDAEGLGQDPANYDEVGDAAGLLGTDVARERLVQVDLTEPGSGVVIGANGVRELLRGVELLHQVTAAP